MTGKTKAGSESEYLIAEPPETKDWEDLREAARGCRACPLWREATQTVFGEGAHSAKMMLIGEQPGDAEDRGGRPFVGPAGNYSTRRWKRPVLTGPAFTSRMW